MLNDMKLDFSEFKPMLFFKWKICEYPKMVLIVTLKFIM